MHSYANGFELVFSTKDFCGKWKVGVESANNAVKILGAYGYIEFYSARRGRFINYYSPEEKEKQKEVSLSFLKSEYAQTSKKSLKKAFYKRITELTGESDIKEIEKNYFGNTPDSDSLRSSESIPDTSATPLKRSLTEDRKTVNNKLIDAFNKNDFNFGG